MDTPAAAPVPGTVFERDGKQRQVVGFIPASRLVGAAIEWRRPGQDWRSRACSANAWSKWVTRAREILEKSCDA